MFGHFTTLCMKGLKIKGALSRLKDLATVSTLKMMKNTFYFTLKALFLFKTFKFLSWSFVHVEKMASLER